LKVYAFNFTDIKGGAAIATNRIHTSFRKEGIDSEMIVYRKFSNDKTVIGPANKIICLYRIFRQKLGQAIGIFFKKNASVFNSPSFLPSNWAGIINKSDVDIVNLHWVNLDFISIEDIAAIRKPLVWTLHDMWAFCGAEHLAWNDAGYVTGYDEEGNGSFSLNRWVWQRKKKAWQVPIHIVAPSSWLASCVKKSALMHDWPVSVIPNPIDTKQWLLLDKIAERKKAGIPEDEKLVLFSTSEDLFTYHKGFDLLLEALTIVAKEVPFKILVIGSLAPIVPVVSPVEIIFKGFVKDIAEMNHFFSLADLVVVPSRQESLSLVAMEAITCGRPVVAFDNSGITDVVKHMHNGYMAKAFEINDMANGISMILKDEQLAENMGANGRKYSELNFDTNVIAKKYIDLYSQVIAGNK
jgi:glycosyltransferase involved in cell wall biosynthesis